jgi:hypothetical protein
VSTLPIATSLSTVNGEGVTTWWYALTPIDPSDPRKGFRRALVLHIDARPCGGPDRQEVGFADGSTMPREAYARLLNGDGKPTAD